MNLKTVALALFTLLSGFFLGPGAVSGAALAGEQGKAVAEVETIAPGRPIWIAFYIAPKKGAYVSWVDQTSGDVGFHVDLELPEGFSKGELVRPAPQPVGDGVFGYGGAFWALQEILIDRKAGFSDSYEIAGAYIWHECASGLDCRDLKKEFSLQLPYGQGLPDPEAAAIFSRARAAAVPHLPWPVSYRADSIYIELELFIGEVTADTIAEVYILPVRGRERGNFRTRLELFRSEGGVQLQGEAADQFLAGEKLDALLFITFKGDAAAKVYRVRSANDFEQNTGLDLAAPGVANLTLWAALGLAFLGGILLNLMPCVFPVLTLKIFGIVKAGAVSSRRLKLDSLAYTAGILLSFLIVALLLLTFRSWGQQVGWGFQLQSPYFITVMALVLFTVSLSFAGLFEIRLPFAIGGKSDTEGALGSFYTGMLATLMATPCTAPFMAPALGFALTLPTPDAVLIFLGLGLGLAAPYLLIGFIPKASSIFPKPGRWMETLKKILAIPVLLTVGWLLWVLFAQTGSQGVWIALMYMALVLAFLLFLRASALWANKTRVLGLALYALSALAILQMTLPKFVTVERPGVAGAEAVEFSETAIWNLRLQGKGVFVNYTATWCITCIINERLVFRQEKFQRFLAENNIVYMVADWTNPDAGIAASLEGLGRTALPVYAFYPPGGPTREPVLLPEILTLEKTLEILSSKLP